MIIVSKGSYDVVHHSDDDFVVSVARLESGCGGVDRFCLLVFGEGHVFTAGVGYGVGIAVDGFFFLHATRLELHGAEAEEGVGFVDFSLHVR